MEIGSFPLTDNTCGTWKSTFSEGGTVKQVKDYKLCRGTGADNLYIDEGAGVKLTVRIIGDALVAPFKNDSMLFVSTMRLRGEVLERGNSRDPAESYRAFRGRDPRIDALLRNRGFTL
jgi:hypothetical protein